MIRGRFETSRQGGGLIIQTSGNGFSYLHYRLLYGWSAAAFIAVLALLSLISTLKPWMRSDKLKRAAAWPRSAQAALTERP